MAKIKFPLTSTPTPRIRACLGCSREFKSLGPGNRFCSGCRRRADEMSSRDHYVHGVSLSHGERLHAEAE